MVGSESKAREDRMETVNQNVLTREQSPPEPGAQTHQPATPLVDSSTHLNRGKEPQERQEKMEPVDQKVFTVAQATPEPGAQAQKPVAKKAGHARQRIAGINRSSEKLLTDLGFLQTGLQKHEKDSRHPDITVLDVANLISAFGLVYQAIQVARAQYSAGSKALSLAIAAARKAFTNIAERLRSLYGASSTTLADFG